MQVLIGRLMLPALQATGKVMNPIGTAGISLIDARDVGAVAARVLTSHDWDGQTLALTGPALGHLRRDRRDSSPRAPASPPPSSTSPPPTSARR